MSAQPTPTTPAARRGGGVVRRPNGKWRARYRDADGVEHAKHFARKADAEAWQRAQRVSVTTGTHVNPRAGDITVAAWCDRWLDAYAAAPSTRSSAESHIKAIKADLGSVRMSALTPSRVNAFIRHLGNRYAPGTVHVTFGRLRQVMRGAVAEGIIHRSPCESPAVKRPKMGKPRDFLPTTADVLALRDFVPDHLVPAIMLGAFAGLRLGEVCGLRWSDVDTERATVHPRQQFGGRPLKNTASDAAVPVPAIMLEALAPYRERYPGETVVTDGLGGPCGPWLLDRVMRSARRAGVIPDRMTFHSLRHYFASLLIANGADIKLVQQRVRHGSPTVTLSTYAHLWPDKDETTRAMVAGVVGAFVPADRPQIADR